MRPPGATTPPPRSQPGRLRRALGLAIAVAAIGALGIATALQWNGGGAVEHGAAPPAADDTAAPSEPDPPIDRVLSGGPGEAHAVAMSPDGGRVLAVRTRGVDVWSARGQRTGWLAIDGDRVDGASWATDGGRVIVWGGETVRLWSAETGALIATVQAGMGAVVDAELSPDGAHAVTLGKDGTRRLWDLASGAIEKLERDAAVGAAPAVADVAAPPAPVYLDEDGAVRLRRTR